MHLPPILRLRVLFRLLSLPVLVLATALGGTAYAMTDPPGTDVSSYQHGTSLNWASVQASGVKFAFIKATEGTGYTNPYFAGDWASTGKIGLYHGAYHFARPSVGSAGAQAKYFAAAIGKQTGRGTLPPVLDLEATGGLGRSQLVSWTHTFLSTVQQLTGRTPMVYCSPAFWRDNLGDDTGFHAYPLWIANYGVSQPSIPGGWPTWTFWQTNSTSRISGISGNVDADVFNGSMAQLAKMALDSSTTATTLTMTPSTLTPTAGAAVTFAGKLLTSAGTAVTGRTVTLQSQPSGSSTWTAVGSTTSGSTGAWSLSEPVSSAASYRAVFAGDTTYGASTSATSALAPATTTPASSSITLTPSAGSVYVASPATLSGVLRNASGAPVAKRTVTIVQHPVGDTTRTTLATVTTNAQGAFSAPTTLAGPMAFRSKYLGDSTVAAAYSPWVKVLTSLRPTTATLTPSVPAPFSGQTTTLSGTLTGAAAGPVTTSPTLAPLASRSVTLQSAAPGSTTWSTVATLTTDAGGAFSSTQTVTQPASYRVLYGGEALYQPATSTSADVTITPPAATQVVLGGPASQPRTISAGRTVSVGGWLRGTDGAAVGGQQVELWRRAPGSSVWTRAGHATSGAVRGWWSFQVTPSSSTQYQVVFAGTSEHAPATSPTVVVRVR